ncbi:erythromycin esterase family protein [Stackebrandtia nassauensis]|uniref:Erythromycin esterase n=1 Tax=Stackebrandtia nassauensis (strain DSM 44728 / CIP 108903 / NRRL B-16338 / NBRC 102104 / LLR-40K-21) TaxID=446470 RepID=D3PZB0_STANL|nr:erythromycin esterase family protein [Stackebrandtia nassauensis]ADD41584.1 Erythromycin esterase [Stackebrandtia nassauensis DSM 44728]
METIPLNTLDPAAPLDDLDWLDGVVGDARVVAIGESSHYNREFFQLRTRLLRHLVERHGFTALAIESGFTEGWRTDAWVRGAGEDAEIGEVLATGVTSMFGLWTEAREQLEWLREHNRRADRGVGFYGIDLPGSQASMLPGLDAVTEYLVTADPKYTVDPAIRDTVTEYAASSAFGVPQAIQTYLSLGAERRDAITAGLADLVGRMRALRAEYVDRTDAESFERALRTLLNTVALDAMVREVARGNPEGIHSSLRDSAIADTVKLILDREERVVIGAHNAHVQRSAFTFPSMGTSATMGMHLAEHLDEDYVTIGTTFADGEILATGEGFYAGELFSEAEKPQPGSLDALMAASGDGAFAVDLRQLSKQDADLLAGTMAHRISSFYIDVNPSTAFDAIVHIPQVTAATPDPDALAHSPAPVRETFAKYRPE